MKAVCAYQAIVLVREVHAMSLAAMLLSARGVGNLGASSFTHVSTGLGCAATAMQLAGCSGSGPNSCFSKLETIQRREQNF